MITDETRRAANRAVDKKNTSEIILNIFRERTEPLSAWHIWEITGIDINDIRPRLTELSDPIFCSKHYQRQHAFLKPIKKIRHFKSRRLLAGYVYNRYIPAEEFHQDDLF